MTHIILLLERLKPVDPGGSSASLAYSANPRTVRDPV